MPGGAGDGSAMVSNVAGISRILWVFKSLQHFVKVGDYYV